jgi:hypothetical protein
MNPRREIMHAAVAAGGASAALMHFAIACADKAEIRAAADECLEPLLRAALLAIGAAGFLPGEYERRRLKTAIEDYIDAPEPVPGRCRVCGCAEVNACAGVTDDRFGKRNCAWADTSRTLCDNPACLEAARGVAPAEVTI